MTLVADLRLDEDDDALEPGCRVAIVPQQWTELPPSFDPGPLGLVTAMLDWTGYAFCLGQLAALMEWLTPGRWPRMHE